MYYNQNIKENCAILILIIGEIFMSWGYYISVLTSSSKVITRDIRSKKCIFTTESRSSGREQSCKPQHGPSWHSVDMNC